MATGLDLLSGAGVVNDGLVVLVRAVGEVHADDVETGITQTVDGLDRVGLGANGADNGGTAVVARGSVCGVQRGKPRDLTAELEVFLGGGGHDALGTLVGGSGSHGGRVSDGLERGRFRWWRALSAEELRMGGWKEANLEGEWEMQLIYVGW